MKKRRSNNNQPSAVLEFREFRPYDHIDDPVEELINEFNDLENDLQDEYEKASKKASELYDEVIEPEDCEDLVEYVDDQLSVLQESTRRLKFYLDEIEIFISDK